MSLLKEESLEDGTSVFEYTENVFTAPRSKWLSIATEGAKDSFWSSMSFDVSKETKTERMVRNRIKNVLTPWNNKFILPGVDSDTVFRAVHDDGLFESLLSRYPDVAKMACHPAAMPINVGIFRAGASTRIKGSASMVSEAGTKAILDALLDRTIRATADVAKNKPFELRTDLTSQIGAPLSTSSVEVQKELIRLQEEGRLLHEMTSDRSLICGFRVQPEAAGKIRRSTFVDFASQRLKNGYVGNTHPYTSCRVRSVFNIPRHWQADLVVFNKVIMQALHHDPVLDAIYGTEPSNIKSQIIGKMVMLSDISNFEDHQFTDDIKYIIHRLSGERGLVLHDRIRTCRLMGYDLTDDRGRPNAASADSEFSGLGLDVRYMVVDRSDEKVASLFEGNYSGWAFTTIVNKLTGAAVGLRKMCVHHKVDPFEIARLIDEGKELPFVFLCCGDDLIMEVNQAQGGYESLRASLSERPISFDFEVGDLGEGRYTGMKAHLDGKGLVYDLTLSIESYLLNSYFKEFDYTVRSRDTWAVGFVSREQTFEDSLSRNFRSEFLEARRIVHSSMYGLSDDYVKKFIPEVAAEQLAAIEKGEVDKNNFLDLMAIKRGESSRDVFKWKRDFSDATPEEREVLDEIAPVFDWSSVVKTVNLNLQKPLRG